MTVEEDNKLTEQAFITALYERPVSKETSRTGQVAVVLGFIELVVVYFGATLEPTSAWPIKFPNSGTVLPLVLFCALVLLLASFSMQAIADFFRSRETGLLITRYINQQKKEAAYAEAAAIDEHIHAGQIPDDGYDPDAWWEEASKVARAAEEAVTKVEGKLGGRAGPRMLRQIRICAELIVPLAVGIAALVAAAPKLTLH